MHIERAEFIPVDLDKINAALAVDANLRSEVMCRAGLDCSVGFSSDKTLKCSVRESGARFHPEVDDLKAYYEGRIRDVLLTVLTEVEVA